MSCKHLSHYQHDFSNLNKEPPLNDFAIINSYLNDNNLGVNAKFNRFSSNLDVVVNTYAHWKSLQKYISNSEINHELIGK